jgi:hypothetical protein
LAACRFFFIDVDLRLPKPGSSASYREKALHWQGFLIFYSYLDVNWPDPPETKHP